MSDIDRRERILRRLVAEPGLDAARLCQVGAEVVGMSGAGIMLVAGEEVRGAVCASNPTSARIEELQYELGEGPCLDAFLLGRPVLAPDLATEATTPWLAFARAAVAEGVLAVFGFAVHVGAVRLGAFHVYRDQPGALSDDQHADALVMAEIAAHTILALQADAPPEALAAELLAPGGFPYELHQASGRVAVQLGVGVDEAVVRLRAHAFGEGRALGAVARDVVAGRLRFDPGSGEAVTAPRA